MIERSAEKARRFRRISTVLIAAACIATDFGWGVAPVDASVTVNITKPNHKLTPGKTSNAVTAANIHSTICVKGYAGSVRNVTGAAKQAVFKEYHILAIFNQAPYTIDHLIPLEVGGSNDIKNLWPEPDAQSKLKDKGEGRAKRSVCHAKTSLAKAQKIFKTNWRDALTLPV